VTEDAILRFDKATYDAACELVKAAPLSLTEFHFDQLAIVSPRLETDAREAVRQAQLAIVRANQTPAPVTKSAEPVKAPETLEEFVQRYGKKPVTWAALMKVLNETDAIIIKEMKTLRVRCGHAGAGQQGSAGARLGRQRRCARAARTGAQSAPGTQALWHVQG
jgi:hypothetical protein